MSPFWSSLFSHIREGGRNAPLFMCALAGGLAVLFLVGITLQSELRQYIVPALPWLGLIPVIWIGVAVRRARRRRRDRLQRERLSDDELHKARAKLVKPRPMPSGPAGPAARG